MSIRVMIVDDQQLMREGLKTILSIEKDVEVVALAENGQAALDMAASHRPDVVLMDIRMPVMNGVDCTQELKQRFPETRVLVLTTFDDDEYIIDALRNGAVGYLLKDLPSEQLVNAIRNVYSGISIMQPEITAKLLSHISSTAGSASSRKQNEAVESIGKMDEIIPLGELTQREKEVLRLLAKGLSNREISKSLFISEGTVKNYISSIYDKLGVYERSKVMIYAMQKGLVE